MQYWIFYEPSTGGRNFARLLENAENMYAADGFTGFREKSVSPNNYQAAKWASLNGIGCSPFIENIDTSDPNIQLNTVYQSIVANRQNTVLLAHYRYFDEIDNFVHKNIVEQDQIKINIYVETSSDAVVNQIYNQVLYNNYYRSNFNSGGIAKTMEELVNENSGSKQQWIDQYKARANHFRTSDEFHLQLDSDLMFTHYTYLSTQLQTIGINLSEETFNEWCQTNI